MKEGRSMVAEMKKLEDRIGVDFKNKALLLEALTHRSYLNENPGIKTGHNERLEYLGDAVLGLIVAEHLFNKFPDKQPEELTFLRAALVNYRILGRIARELDLGKSVLLSKGAARDRDKAWEVILADAIEALIGAIYLDKGYKATSKFVEDNVLNHLEGVLKEVTTKGSYRDPKSILQESLQGKMKITPTYKVLERRGPAHAQQFTVGVYFDGELQATGTGFSRQEAEHGAAEEALRNLEHGK